ncbi:MAG: response regulator [Alphaproteobacteria bacterium]|nr:response regulator [Alphaproteobacteria bacterium]
MNDEPPLVLVADDDQLLRAILEHKLVTAGYRFVGVENGHEALACAHKLRPAAIVLDAMMPVLDGFETLRRLKAEPELKNTVVIMLTALKREQDIVTGLREGAADYLSKPFNPDELLVRLSRLLPGAGQAS